MSNRNLNAPLNHHAKQADWNRRSSCYMQNPNLSNLPPQFDQQQMLRSSGILDLAQQLLQAQQAQQNLFTYGPIPLGQMQWMHTQNLNMVGLQNDISSSRRYSCSVQNLVPTTPANYLGRPNKPEQCHWPQDTARTQQGAYVKNGPSARPMHGKCFSSQRLNFVGRRDIVSPPPMKRARLYLKFSNLPPKFTEEDVIQQILGTDRILVTCHGKPDISLRRGKDGSTFCVAQFINKMEAEKIRIFWNETQIMKGGEKLIVEYFDDH